MYMKMKFAPIKFQAALAAGGVSLMAFNFLQFALPHAGSLVKLTDIAWADLTVSKILAYSPLIGIMLISTAINLILTIILLKGFLQLISNGKRFNGFISNTSTNITIFAPIASLSMTANVIWGPFSFFIPNLSIQSLILPSLIFFGILWGLLFLFEFKVMKIWLTNELDVDKLNFVWLLDVFAFALVSLTGTGIASMANDPKIASTAAFASLFVLIIGVFLFVTKLAYLLYLQIKRRDLPDKPIMPAFFLVIPIVCLFGLSFYRVMSYLAKTYAFDVSVISFALITFSYVVTIGWGLFTVYLLFDYLRKDFYRSKFSPTQWGMV